MNRRRMKKIFLETANIWLDSDGWESFFMWYANNIDPKFKTDRSILIDESNSRGVNTTMLTSKQIESTKFHSWCDIFWRKTIQYLQSQFRCFCYWLYEINSICMDILRNGCSLTLTFSEMDALSAMNIFRNVQWIFLHNFSCISFCQVFFFNRRLFFIEFFLFFLPIFPSYFSPFFNFFLVFFSEFSRIYSQFSVFDPSIFHFIECVQDALFYSFFFIPLENRLTYAILIMQTSEI